MKRKSCASAVVRSKIAYSICVKEHKKAIERPVLFGAFTFLCSQKLILQQV